MKRYFFLAFFVFFITVGVFAQTIGRVEQSRTTFVVFNPNGSRISSTNIGSGSHTLAGWGRDFFVVQNRNSVYTHDTRGRRMASWNSGGTDTGVSNISSITVIDDTITVFIRVAQGSVSSRIGDVILPATIVLDRYLVVRQNTPPQQATTPAPTAPPQTTTPQGPGPR